MRGPENGCFNESDFGHKVPMHGSGADPSGILQRATRQKTKPGLQILEPFQVFCTERRDALQRENPHLTASDITSLLSQIWRSMRFEEKIPYVSISRQYNESRTDVSAVIMPTSERVEPFHICYFGSGNTAMKVVDKRPNPPAGVAIIPRGKCGCSASLASVDFLRCSITDLSHQDGLSNRSW